MFKRIKEDIEVFLENDPAARNALEIILTYPGLYAIWFYRLSHILWNRNLRLLARIISNFARFLTGIEIHPAAKIGRRLFIDHGSGIVIGETCEIGDDVLIFQGVTLGGTGKERGKRHPTVGNHVMLSAGAKVLGSMKIGDYSKIGAGAVVIQEVPPNATVVGVPGRVVIQDGIRINDKNEEMINIISDKINLLEEQIEQLKEEIQILSRKGVYK
ncbi:serine O-acetyltransferase [Vulcanibacillus modesticaldus]|uniref:Serine acetyltransferase n=1 Tax=Vulcanibacillus modesticaldus TaxID=337097 RepID=A0A1D2YRY8_9BACI|nr:serine O-acetyltransferase [Vulcanibacillus modesticaldus]OEF96396.1 serine O-acetyltransferase [Vulcanibacillus modesticaldus]